VGVHQQPWDLHQEGMRDNIRHFEKLRDLFKRGIKDLVSREDIITAPGDKRVKIPVRALEHYRFKFNDRNQKKVGSADFVNDYDEGDIIDVIYSKGHPSGGGDEGDEIFYEAEMTIDDLVDIMLEDLQLPRLDPRKVSDELKEIEYKWTDIRKHGSVANIDKKRSLYENIKRNAARGEPVVKDIKDDDLRYRTWREYHKPITAAVVFAMMDVSGSMDTTKRYMAKATFFWILQFLKKKYTDVRIEFIAHTTDAKVVGESEFFDAYSYGGTICSSAYEKAIQLIKEKYPPHRWNIYAFHFSDGDNFHEDNQKCLELVTELLKIANMVGYAEIDEHAERERSELWNTFQSYIERNKCENFVISFIRDKEGIWNTLKSFFGGDLNGQ
jgi:hypothetical protein